MGALKHVSTFQLKNMDEYSHVRSQLEYEIQLLYPDKTIYLTMVAIFEALHNAIEHGKFPITVRVEQNVSNQELIVEVNDSGQGFSVDEKLKQISEKGVDQLLVENMFSTRGRGILLMFTTLKSVSFNRKGNKVSLVANL